MLVVPASNWGEVEEVGFAPCTLPWGAWAYAYRFYRRLKGTSDVFLCAIGDWEEDSVVNVGVLWRTGVPALLVGRGEEPPDWQPPVVDTAPSYRTRDGIGFRRLIYREGRWLASRSVFRSSGEHRIDLPSSEETPAECSLNRHTGPAPDFNCTCGYHAALDPWDVAVFFRPVSAIAVVGALGRTAYHDNAWRSEGIKHLAVVLPLNSPPLPEEWGVPYVRARNLPLRAWQIAREIRAGEALE